jgi:hypothetical protein
MDERHGQEVVIIVRSRVAIHRVQCMYVFKLETTRLEQLVTTRYLIPKDRGP